MIIESYDGLNMHYKNRFYCFILTKQNQASYEINKNVVFIYLKGSK